MAGHHHHHHAHPPRLRKRYHIHCDSHEQAEITGNDHKAFGIGIALNIAFIIAEVIYGLKVDSLALLADAGHNLSDVLGLFLAWGAAWLALKRPSARFTYGFGSASILAALANAALLLVAVGGIVLEALHRFRYPEPVAETTVMAVAAIGVLINGATAWLFAAGSRHDLNIRGAFLHMAADAGVSLAVVVSAALILLTGWLWLDPAVSLLVAAVIVFGTWGLFKDSVSLALHAAPRGVDIPAVRAFLAAQPGIAQVHDLHVWAMSTTQTAMSVHLRMPGGHPGDQYLHHLAEELEGHFSIDHATIQVELGDTQAHCAFAGVE